MPPGVTNNWATAKAKLGLADGVCRGRGLRLVGGGTFAPECSLADEGLNKVEICAGIYLLAVNNSSELDNRLGVANGPVHVRSGASLVLAGAGGRMINGRTLHLAGAGVAANCGAVHFAKGVSWERARSITWELDDDATLSSDEPSLGNGTFLYAVINANGHTLTLKGGAYRFGWDCAWRGGGKMVVDGAVITASPAKENEWPVWTTFKNDAKNPGAFFFRNGAKLAPDTPELLSMLDDVTFETADCVLGATVGTREASLKMPRQYVFRRFSGTPTIEDVGNSKVVDEARSISLSVTNCYVVRTADLLATPARVLTVPTGAVSFSPECRFELDEPNALSGGTHTLCRVLGASAAIEGRPRSAGATSDAAWVTRLAADRKELLLRQMSGLMISFR